MAIKFNEQYPARSNPPSSEYPSGSYRNRSTPDAHDGTYLDEVWANDKYGFLVKLLKEAGIEPNGDIDNAVNSQYYDALMVLIGARFLQTTNGSAVDKGVSQNAINLALGVKPSFSVFSGADRLIKPDSYSTIFIKKSDGVYIKKGVTVLFESTSHTFTNDTAIGTFTVTPGSDYVVIVKSNGTIRIALDPFNAPATVADDELIIGGFHYGLVPKDATVASGGFATSGAGMRWTQADVDRIRGVNEYTFWDLRFRAGGVINAPGTPRHGQLSNHGMVFDSTSNMYVALYHTSTNVDLNGVSKAGSDIASGTVLPTIPRAFGGNGSAKYGNLDWWTANEIAKSHGARLLWESEFNSRAYGVTENKVAGGAAVTYPKTERIVGLTSRIGCEQAVGTIYYWGLDTNFRYDTSTYSWKDVTGGRGQLYTEGSYGLIKALFGGDRTNVASDVGSRYVSWYSYPWHSVWSFGVVVARDLLIL